MKINWPNTLTWIRIVAIPLIVVVFYLPVPWARPAAGLLFALAGVTDWLDGYLARRLGQTSSFGAFLDPVADKLAVATALVLLVQQDPEPYLSIVAAIIIGREITVSALREWMSQVGERSQVAVSFFAKCKTNRTDRRHQPDALRAAAVRIADLPHWHGAAACGCGHYRVVHARLSSRRMARDDEEQLEIRLRRSARETANPAGQ